MPDQQPIAPSKTYIVSLDRAEQATVDRHAASPRKTVLDSLIHNLRTLLTSIKSSASLLLTTPWMTSDAR